MGIAEKCVEYRSKSVSYELFIILIIVCHVPLTLSLNRSEEARLLKSKFADYNKKLRPVENITNAVHIDVSFDLLAIREFDEVHETISVVGFLTLTWTDEFMTWNPNDFSGIQDLMVDSGDVWTPNLVLVNPADDIKTVKNDWSKIRFNNNGEALNLPGAVFSAICRMDTTFYPWDVQTCSFVFNTWGYSSTEVALHSPLDKILVSYFTENGEWELIGSSGYVEDHSHLVVFKISLERRPKFVVVNVILPIVFMSLLNVMAFLIPTASGERLSYCITVLLAQAVFLTIVGDNLPKTSDPMPILSHYLMAVFTISVSITVSVILSLAVYFRDENVPVPKYLIAFSCIFCAGERKDTNIRKATKIDNTNAEKKICMDDMDYHGYAHVHGKPENDNTEETCEIYGIDKSYLQLIKKSNNNTFHQYDQNMSVNCIQDVRDDCDSKNSHEYLVSWKDVSIAMDRILFVFFFLSTVGCTLWSLMRIRNK